MSEVATSLLQILRCPQPDRGELREVSGQLICMACGQEYPVVDGMPVMLTEAPS